MKKLFALFLVLCIFTSILIAPAFSEDLDLSDYSISDLVMLKQRIEFEIRARGFSALDLEMWYDYGVGSHIPKMTLHSGEDLEFDSFMYNDDVGMYVIVKNTEKVDFETYVTTLKLIGFTEVERQTTSSYIATNEEGYKVDVTNWNSAGISISGRPPKN